MRLLAIAALTFGLVLAGCDSGPAGRPAPRPPPKKPQAAAKAPAAAAETKPEIVATVEYAYNPVGKRDPFRAPEELRQRTLADMGAAPCTEPLCQWDLEQLTLTAVVTGDANPFAMLEDPQGRGYIVRRNSRVGRQGGKVTQILRDRLIVTEYWTQPDGTSKPIPKDMRMPADKGFDPAVDLISNKTYQ